MSEDWQKWAACAGKPTAYFYVERSSAVRGSKKKKKPPPKPPTIELRGRLLCMTCPVRRECLEEALTVKVRSGTASRKKPDGRIEAPQPMAEPWGVWGGLGPDQRRSLLKLKLPMQEALDLGMELGETFARKYGLIPTESEDVA